MIGRCQERASPTLEYTNYSALVVLFLPLDFQNFRAELAGPNRELSFLVLGKRLVLGF